MQAARATRVVLKAENEGGFIMGAGIIALIVAGLFLAGTIWIYNNLVRMRNRVRNAWKQIDVQLKRRHDLIPNLVEAVKDYMDFEQETLQQVISARNQAVAAEGRGASAVGKAESQLSSALGNFFAVAESYPELKANQNVRELQEELTSTENRIAFARQHLNDQVMAINNMVEMFPSNLVAGVAGFQREQYLEIEAAARETPSVDLRE